MTIDPDQLKADRAEGTPIYDAGVICQEVYYAVYSGPMSLVDHAAYLAATASADRAEALATIERGLSAFCGEDNDRLRAELAALRASPPDVLRAERERAAQIIRSVADGYDAGGDHAIATGIRLALAALGDSE